MTRQNPAGLGRSDTTAAIEEAFFIALRGGHARPRMIRCAVDALCAGQGGPATVSLAGADAQVPLPALLELFRAAAAELLLAERAMALTYLQMAKDAYKLQRSIGVVGYSLGWSPLRRLG